MDLASIGKYSFTFLQDSNVESSAFQSTSPGENFESDEERLAKINEIKRSPTPDSAILIKILNELDWKKFNVSYVNAVHLILLQMCSNNPYDENIQNVEDTVNCLFVRSWSALSREEYGFYSFDNWRAANRCFDGWCHLRNLKVAEVDIGRFIEKRFTVGRVYCIYNDPTLNSKTKPELPSDVPPGTYTHYCFQGYPISSFPVVQREVLLKSNSSQIVTTSFEGRSLSIYDPKVWNEGRQIEAIHRIARMPNPSGSELLANLETLNCLGFGLMSAKCVDRILEKLRNNNPLDPSIQAIKDTVSSLFEKKWSQQLLTYHEWAKTNDAFIYWSEKYPGNYDFDQITWVKEISQMVATKEIDADRLSHILFWLDQSRFKDQCLEDVITLAKRINDQRIDYIIEPINILLIDRWSQSGMSFLEWSKKDASFLTWNNFLPVSVTQHNGFFSFNKICCFEEYPKDISKTQIDYIKNHFRHYCFKGEAVQVISNFDFP